MSRSGRAVVEALGRAQGWLENHRKSLLPDAALFWRFSVEVGRPRVNGSRRRPNALEAGARDLLLSSDYLAVARRAGALLGRLPLSSPPRLRLARGRSRMRRRSPRLASSIVVDAAAINRALAEAAAGALSLRAARWARDHGSSTGYALTHKLLALVFLAAARGDPALPPRDAPVAGKVLAELRRELGKTYVDLTAQRVACLALAGMSNDVLEPGVRWLVRHQRRTGDWHYFETGADAYETVERVHTGRSPLLRPPLWKTRRDPVLEAPRIDLAHRGHATAVAAAALACFVWR